MVLQKNPEDAAFSGPKLFPQNFTKFPLLKNQVASIGPQSLKKNIILFFFIFGLAGKLPTRGARGGASPVPKPTKLRI
jgi:hypothetical protein